MILKDKIILVNERNGPHLKTRLYAGYGQILKIIDDGTEKIIIVEPFDPVRGIRIHNLQIGTPILEIPKSPIETISEVITNIENAKLFCEEFSRRKTELLA